MKRKKRQKDRILNDELPKSVGAQYSTGDQWRNNSWKNEEMEKKQKQHPNVGVTGDGSKSDAVKSNIALEPGILGPWKQIGSSQIGDGRVNISILKISKLK